ncbi:DUF4012 domain-containing protein [Demequina iriomotensis]|uniref:DUF4012 domain-containing protein n=1 Tax=Demequina iriomotensis TaxID=1536641 RepID=UPI0007862C40|nr:DUF4012 domain-containing protein [Demequina iriomotensis]
MTRRHASSIRPRRVWPWVVAGAVGVAMIGAAAFVWDGLQLLHSKDALTENAAAAKDALTDGDPQALTVAVDDLETAARDFAGATDGPHWWIASQIPWVKDQARPLVAAGRAVEALAADALAPLAAMDNLDALAVPGFEDGRIDPYTLEPYRAALAQASMTLEAQDDALAAVDLSRTRDEVAEPFQDLRAQLATVGDLVEGGHVAAELLPTMLGGEGARTYLVMVQNNAEPRATGGIPGAVISLAVDDGRMEMSTYSSAGPLTKPEGVGGLTDDEARIFGDLMEIYPQDVTFTPEYPRAAEQMTRFWAAEYGTEVDGVISVDPVALGWMLEGADPVEVGPFSITGDNLAQVMLNESYLEYPDPQDQDAFFGRASSELFGRIVSGDGTALEGVERSIEAGRFMVWSAHEDEQDLLDRTAIAGAFLERDDAVGVFVNDGSESKIGYYVDVETTLTNRMCTDGSLAGQTVDVTLTHTFDGDVSALPWYVSGGGNKVPEGEFAGNVLVFPAVGTGVTNLTVDGGTSGLAPEILDGRAMSEVWVELAPGQTRTLSYEVDALASGLLASDLVVTPGAKPNVYATRAEYLVDGC